LILIAAAIVILMEKLNEKSLDLSTKMKIYALLFVLFFALIFMASKIQIDYIKEKLYDRKSNRRFLRRNFKKKK